MTDPIDKAAVQRSFDKVAFEYDVHAGLQQKTACALASLCGRYVSSPRRALDVGTGTGYGVRLLCHRFPDIEAFGLDFSFRMLQRSMLYEQYQSRSHFVCADAEGLPFAGDTFDMIHSSLFIQWHDDKEALFFCFKEILRDKGWLFFSTFGPRTLFELRESWKAVDDDHHTLRFASASRIKEMLKRSGFTVHSCKRSVEVIHHQGVEAALRSLKDIGAQNHVVNRRAGLTSPGKLRAMSNEYLRRFGVQGLVPMTYEVLLFAASAD